MDGVVAIVSRSADDTRELGRALGEMAQPGDVFLLHGPFGAGKTVLVQGVAAGLGVQEPVTSPSFVLMTSHRGRLRLNHIDLYRLDGRVDDEIAEAVAEHVSSDDVTAIEWPRGLPDYVTRGAIRITFELRDGDERSVQLDATPRTTAALRQLAQRTPEFHQMRSRQPMVQPG